MTPIVNIINNPTASSPLSFEPRRDQWRQQGVGVRSKINAYVTINEPQKKRATAKIGQSPCTSLNISPTFDRDRDKKRRNILIIILKIIIIKTSQMYVFKN